nr:MAG TPA: hypothetical protein [Caudoviricetes sp.]DAX95104.1 MAG TPA: hypothetical protein [Caudoviricetes sp.]
MSFHTINYRYLNLTIDITTYIYENLNLHI